jgi:hypothetical protein
MGAYGDENAVSAGEYFVGLYQTWADIAASLNGEHQRNLDRVVCMIFNGESGATPETIQSLATELSGKNKLMDFTLFLTSLMSGEILSNPFVAANREKIGAAVLNDALNETARRVLGGKAEEAAEINKWNILSAIAAITAGADKAIQININLKGAFSAASN